jgi:two-component system OmpR family sensor kinase
MRSLRTRLMTLFGGAILFTAAIQFATAFQSAINEANRLFDRHMEQTAFALKNTGVDVVDWYSTPIEDRETYDYVIQIWAKEGVRLYQSRTFRFLPEQGPLGISTVELENGDWRVLALKSDQRVIQVAQKMAVRRSAAVSFVLKALWPIIPVSLLLFLLSWAVVTSGLAPLNEISRTLAGRSADSLEPVSSANAPQEVSGLIDELNSLLRRMGYAIRSQQRFLADAAHELRSPLTALRLQVQTLSIANDEATRRQAISRLLGGVDRASRLVQQLLSLASQESAVPVAASCAVVLAECVEDALEDVAALARSRNVSIRVRSSLPFKVLGDHESLRMMVRNLLDNAILYTDAGTEVSVAIRQEANKVILLVQDSGPGIPKDDRTRVFDRFYRVAGTAQPGSGLGLGIVKAVAERHRGTVVLGATASGGLEVIVTLPILIGDAVPASA